MSYTTGFYRFLAEKDFSKELTVGFFIDTVIALGMVFIQGANNTLLSQ